MTFEELGAKLRAEREKRDLRIDDAANHLKINPRQLRALEEGNVQSLPHPAYVKGFIRSYATWLGLSAGEIQEALASINGVPTPEVKKPVEQDDDTLEMPAPGNSSSSHKGLIFFLILCLCGGGAWYAWQNGYLDFLKKDALVTNNQTGSELQTADVYLAAKDAEKAKKPEETSQEKVKPDNTPAYPLPLPGNKPPIDIKPAPEVALPPEQSAASANEEKPKDTPPAEEQGTPAPETPVVQNGPHKLVITAVEECWVHSNADKTDTRQFSLRKGDTFALTFADSLELKLGNAGGVRLRYDGQDLPAPGTSGQVRTLTFPPKTNS